MDTDDRLRTADPGLPAGTVTFVLGDIASSTRLWEQHPGEMPAVLARLDVLVGIHLAERGGHRPAEQGEGDNFVAAFAQATDAVAFAGALQAALVAEDWPGGLAVALRIAVHTGDARRRDGGRYMGEALNRCARLRALGHGGQVLVSGAASNLVVDAQTGGLFLRDLGPHQLRDLSVPERVAQLCGPGLPLDFPPLRSMDRMPTNLPVQLTSFVGRAGELAETTLLLADRRLVTLAGAGGCGKTRLAVQLAAEMLDDFPDGVWFANLAPLSDPDLVAATAAAAAGVAELPGQPILDTLADRLAGAHALLVLDNCEHLVDAAAATAEEILRRCPAVRVVATSREPLGAEGETTYRVPSLGLPAGSDDGGCESVTLFADRAALARPTMRIGPEEIAAMSAICVRLDGIPLAIELAAARCRAMTPRQIADRLADHFGLLTGGSRRALPRHRALEASLEWSHGLLGEDERTLLRRLAVFAGGFDLAAAEAVGAATPDEAWAIVDLLTGLVDKSLVLQDDTGRYRMLETVRQFAESRLAAAGEAEDTRHRHAEHYIAAAEAAEPELYGPGLLACRERLGLELDNLRAAEDWAVESGHTDVALRLMLPLNLFWQTYLTEMLQRLKRTLALPSAPELRVEALAMGAEIECQHGDIEQLLAWAREGLSLVDESTDPAEHGYIQLYEGWGSWMAGEDDEALERLIGGLDLMRSSDRPRDSYRMLDGLWAVGLVKFGEGRMAEALPPCEEALARAEAGGNPIAIGRGQLIAAWPRVLRGEFAAGRALAAAGMPTLRGCGDGIWLFGSGAIALVDALSGNGQGVTARLAAEMEEARLLQQVFALSWGLWALAALDTHGYGTGAWAPTLDEAEATMTAMGWSWGTAWCQALRAENLLRDGSVDAARAAADAALETVRSTTRAGLARGPAELTLARVLRAEGDPAAAETAAHRALASLLESDLTPQQVEALELLAGLAAEQGSPAEAVRLFAAAAAARSGLPYPPSPAQAPVLESDLVRARAALDPVAFDDAWAEGAGIPLADAAGYAARGRGPRRRPATGWNSLTPTELEVLGLVAAGLRNPEIAAKLFVSPETIKFHVSNVLAKLGAANRTELAALAARRG